jgi:hypothetical protein
MLAAAISEDRAEASWLPRDRRSEKPPDRSGPVDRGNIAANKREIKLSLRNREIACPVVRVLMRGKFQAAVSLTLRSMRFCRMKYITDASPQ